MKITNIYNLPQPLVDAVTKEYQYKPKQYSVTALLKGSCQAVLERRYGHLVEQDVSEMIWALFGSAVHSILENAQETDSQLKENYLVIDVNGYKLSGIFDLYDEKTKTVTDYKTATAWKVIFDDWDDYRQQTLMYAYMLRKIGFECDKGEIVAILKDHSKAKAKTDKNYPKLPVYKKQFTFTEKDFEEIEKFILSKFIDISVAEDTDTDKLEPCSPKERWETPTKYAVKKEGRKTALKVCESKEQAEMYIEAKGLDSKHYIEERKGECKRCNDYCSVNIYCPFYRKMKGLDNEENVCNL